MRQNLPRPNYNLDDPYKRRSPDRTATPPIYNQPYQVNMVGQSSQRLQQQTAPSNRLGTGLAGPTLQHRIAMALRSGLPTEIDWALHELVRMSYQLDDDIRIEAVMGLADALLDKISTVFKVALPKPGKRKAVYLNLGGKEFDKVLEAALILRNAALQDDNAAYLARRVARTKPTIEKLLSLPYIDYPELMELRYYALDIAESIIPFTPITAEDDPLYTAMKTLLLSPERSTLILGLKALARMAVSDENNSLLQDIPGESQMRVQQLLLLEDDEELLNAALDFLYQFTTYKSNVAAIVAKSGGMGKLVDSLVRLMGFGGKDVKVTVNVMKRMLPLEKLNAEPPALSQEILSSLLKLNEPERCIQWYQHPPKSFLFFSLSFLRVSLR
jgi:chromatin structure-remodeling complex subunit RSC9